MLRLDDVALSIGGRTLFTGLALQANPGDRFGIIGRNGCGKSSLFKLINGELDADAGDIDLPEGWQLAHIAQETPAGPTAAIDFVLEADAELLRLREAIERGEGDIATLHERLDAIDGYTADTRAAIILAGLGFTQEQHQWPLDQFSGGWRGRLNLARALFTRSDLLLLDEPTNHLDIETVLWLQKWLMGYPGVCLIISHDREFLDAISTHILWYDNGTTASYRGNLSVAEQKRSQILAAQAALFEKQQKQAKHLQSFVDRFRAKASKAKQAQSRIKMLERLNASAPIHADAAFDFEFPSPKRLPATLIRIDHANVGYSDNAPPVLADISLSLLPGERIGVLGPNGAGKSTLIKSLCGKLTPQSGTVTISPGLVIGHFAQHQLEQLIESNSPLTHLKLLAGDNHAELELRKFLGRFGFHGEMATEPVGPRSGGERARLALALLAWERPGVLLLDEPTNHLDLSMRQSLMTALQEYEGALLLVSHDRALLEASCDEWVVVGNQQVQRFTGSFDEYATMVQRERSGGEPTSSKVGGGDQKKERRQQAAADRAKRKPLQNKVRVIEREMEKLQAKAERSEQAIADPEFYQQDGDDIAKALKQRGDLQAELDRLEAEWLELSEQLEQMT
ncbi:MAG: ABC transporter ATP-binding protein [Lysobacteraceae bacterium]|nr:MAG: ABC transporter ATP-binding protein [Xanthomonadaceae bacterium]